MQSACSSKISLVMLSLSVFEDVSCNNFPKRQKETRSRGGARRQPPSILYSSCCETLHSTSDPTLYFCVYLSSYCAWALTTMVWTLHFRINLISDHWIYIGMDSAFQNKSDIGSLNLYYGKQEAYLDWLVKLICILVQETGMIWAKLLGSSVKANITGLSWIQMWCKKKKKVEQQLKESELFN